MLRKLTEVLSRICTDTHTQKDVNRNNAQHAILLECINLAIHMETDADLLSQAMTVLGRHILNREVCLPLFGFGSRSLLPSPFSA